MLTSLLACLEGSPKYVGEIWPNNPLNPTTNNSECLKVDSMHRLCPLSKVLERQMQRESRPILVLNHSRLQLWPLAGVWNVSSEIGGVAGKVLIRWTFRSERNPTDISL